MPQRSRARPPTNTTIPQAARHTVFVNCQNTIISGGVINLQVNSRDSDEYDFPTIKLGHLKLVEEVAKQNIVEYREVLHKKTRVVKRRVPEVVGDRRIYVARVHGSQKDFTAVVYKGSDFEKHRAHAEQREEFRHPSLIQLFGVTSSTRLKALIYHDGLIPPDKFRQMHQQSLLGSAYVEYEFGRHFFAALHHWDEVTGKWLLVQDSCSFRPRLETGTMLWIRRSTGQLCIEVSDSEESYTHYPLAYDGGPISSRVHLTSDINLEDKLLSNMSLHDIHNIFCYSDRRWNHIEISDPGTILLGSLSWPTASCVHLFNPFSEISLSDSLGLPDVHVRGWEVADSYMQGSSSPHEGLVILPNGWTRVALADLPTDEECRLLKRIFLGQETVRQVQKTWLSQANNIMDKAGLDADEYYLLMGLNLQFSISSSNVDEFTLQGTFMADSLTDEVYLFLFPTNVANSRGQLAVHLPLETETYYWSFDPDGIEHLPQDYLDKFALPSVRLRARVAALHWSQELYDSIAACHHAKGFDPASQDVAIELGYLLLDVDRLNDLINGGKIEAVDEVELQEDEI